MEKTLVAGKLVREPPEALRRVLLAEAGEEVLLALLETASDEVLGGKEARLWVALTDRRALVLAASDGGESLVESVDPAAVAHRGKLGRDELTMGERKLRCPLLRGGSEFKTFAKLAAAHPMERLRLAARWRYEEGSHDAAAALAEAGLENEVDSLLLTIRAAALHDAGRHDAEQEAYEELVRHDPALTHWDDLSSSIADDSEALWKLYRAARKTNGAAQVRQRLEFLRGDPPRDERAAELLVVMDADAGDAAGALARLRQWYEDEAVAAETVVRTMPWLQGAGLETGALHQLWAEALVELERLDEALTQATRAVALDPNRETLSLQVELLLKLRRTAEAAEPLERLLATGRDDGWVRSRLGEAYEARGELERAVVEREWAIERYLAAETENEVIAAERRALARLHQEIGRDASPEERARRQAYADLLERGLDWAARLLDEPDRIYAGSEVELRVELLAARPLGSTTPTARLTFLEEVINPRAKSEPPPPAPSLLAGGVAGVWPPDEEEPEGVTTDRRGARVRYSVGEEISAGLGDKLTRGLHLTTLRLEIPEDSRPSYWSDRVRAQLELEVTPPGVRFPLTVVPCEPEDGPEERPEEREGTGRVPLGVIIPNAHWVMGEQGRLRVDAHLGLERVPTRIELTLLATERMRAPYKGEIEVESFTWTAPIFPYEHELARVDRVLTLDLPRETLTTGSWTWFEVDWTLRVRLLRKGKPEATVEAPVELRYSPGLRRHLGS